MDNEISLVDLIYEEKYDEFVNVVSSFQDESDYYSVARLLLRIVAENDDMDNDMSGYNRFISFLAPRIDMQGKNLLLVDFAGLNYPDACRILIENGADPHYDNDAPYKNAVAAEDSTLTEYFEETHGC